MDDVKPALTILMTVRNRVMGEGGGEEQFLYKPLNIYILLKTRKHMNLMTKLIIA